MNIKSPRWQLGILIGPLSVEVTDNVELILVECIPAIRGYLQAFARKINNWYKYN